MSNLMTVEKCTNMKKICVVGSINMDLTAFVNKFPKPGETITGNLFGSYPGGKGANQAVAIGKLGGDITMLGKIGDDEFGIKYLKVFEEDHVNSLGVKSELSINTGIAVIEVNHSGENQIIVIPGANSRVDIDFINHNLELLSECDIFLFQLEIPLETVIYTIKMLKKSNKTIILDPAPAKILPNEIYSYIDFITPNETEIEILTGVKINNEEDLKKASNLLISRGVNTVIAKAGKKGAYIINKENFEYIPSFKVTTVDTTAAGDSFNGGFAFSLSNGYGIEESVRFANAVAAISTTGLGAQGAMPDLDTVKIFLKNKTNI